MTERKSTEIKFRVTPSEKARWQADSEREGVSLSELLCRRMNFAADLALQKASITAAWSPDSHPAKSWMFTSGDVTNHTSTSIPHPSTRSLKERRKEACSHSKPPYAFCVECDK